MPSSQFTSLKTIPPAGEAGHATVICFQASLGCLVSSWFYFQLPNSRLITIGTSTRTTHPAASPRPLPKPAECLSSPPCAIRAFLEHFPKLEGDRVNARQKLKNANADSQRHWARMSAFQAIMSRRRQPSRLSNGTATGTLAGRSPAGCRCHYAAMHGCAAPRRRAGNGLPTHRVCLHADDSVAMQIGLFNLRVGLSACP